MEIEQAAAILLCMKKTAVAKETADELQQITRNLFRKRKAAAAADDHPPQSQSPRPKKKANLPAVNHIQPAPLRPRPNNIVSVVDGTALPPRPPLAALQGFIGACTPPFEKLITRSDVRGSLCRLTFPRAFVKANYFQMLNPGESFDDGIDVTVYGPDGKAYAASFRFWSDRYYVICSRKWKAFCRDYELKGNVHWITCWLFRHSGTRGLCFGLTWKAMATA